MVTGCAGFIGSTLSKQLLLHGHEVLGVDAFTDYYERLEKEENLRAITDHSRFTLLEGDLAEIPLPELVDGVAGIFHLAAQPGVRGSFGATFTTYARDNILVTQRLFDAAATAGVRVVYASSSSVYGNAATYPTLETDPTTPVSPYGVTKLCCEHLAGAYRLSAGLSAVGLRYFTVYGPRQRPDMAIERMVRAVLTDGVFTLNGSGEQSRDVTYVDDAVAATIAAMTADEAYTVFNVGGGEETTVLGIISTLVNLTGTTLRINRRPAATGDVRRTVSDTASIRQATGWAPVTPLRSGVEAQVEATAARMREVVGV
jgi:UDP-glucuronate 4-epimerase